MQTQSDRRRIKELERELRRKEKALAEAAGDHRAFSDLRQSIWKEQKHPSGLSLRANGLIPFCSLRFYGAGSLCRKYLISDWAPEAK